MAEPLFVLYSTAGCHLCEQAETLLAALPLLRSVAVEVIDVSDDDALLAQYGSRIPVLASPQGHELQWPFSPAEASAFICNFLEAHGTLQGHSTL